MEGQLTAAADAAGDARPPLLDARGITKQYPGVKALDDVEFELRAGEVHALMGENGAGKSTLIRVLTGAVRQGAGTVRIAGRPVQLQSPAAAQRLGIAAVHQEIDLIPQLSVSENIMLGREPHRFGLIRRRQRDGAARKALARIGVDVDVRRAVQSLPIATRQMVAIARALDMRARIIVLDEPTSCLDGAETARLFEILRALKAENGLGIIFVTHFIEQVFAIADRITVLRNGVRVGCFDAGRLTRLELVSSMLGREIEPATRPVAMKDQSSCLPTAESVLCVKGLGRQGAVAPFDLDLKRGEVVGLAGLLGSGRSEAARLIFGADRAGQGEVRIAGRRMARPTPLKSLRAGMGMVPEDRKAQALALTLSLEENILLAAQAKRGWLRRLGKRGRELIVERAIAGLGIAGPRRGPISTLSGGNQQKAVLARWLATDPRIMILDEPTRGIDVGAKEEIERLIASLRARGLSMLFISSELDEVARDTTRILVLRDRRVVAEVSGAEATPQRIMQAIAGGAGP